MTRSKGCDWWRRNTSSQQRRSFLELGCVLRTPYATTTANAPEVETQEAEALASTEVYVSTFLFINFDLQVGQLLRKPFLYRPHQPVMSRVGVYQDHQIIRKSCVLDVGVLAVAPQATRVHEEQGAVLCGVAMARRQ
jgi:hypothetical protein